MHVKLFQSCPTLCDPMDCSLPGSFVHGILQARIQQWVAGCRVLLQGIFLTQGSNPGLLRLLYCGQVLYYSRRLVVVITAVTVVQSLTCVWFCNPMDTPGFPVLHYLLEFSQVHVHWVDDAIQPSHPLSPTSPAFNLSQYQGLFQWVFSSHQVAKVLELQLQHQSFQWILRTDFL